MALLPQPGQIVTGKLFSEPMRIETAAQISDGTWKLGLVGTQTEKFRMVMLSAAELALLTVLDSTRSFKAEGSLLRLGLQAYSLGIAFEFDPYFGLSVSRVDPLPHQLEAVYDRLLKLARVRFLLADDAGAGKTIMAGLLLRELKLRGLVERALVVCPANLTFQWQRELKDKFDEQFLVLRGFEIRAQYGVNQWLQSNRLITSLDLAKRGDILPSLRQAHWDLVIVDEAHRMSAAADDKKSLRYRLGELLRETTDHYLLLTATPHRGDPLNFALFLRLLDEDAFADVRSIREAMDRRRAPFYLRRIKEAMVYFPEQQPDGKWAARKIFTKRIPHSVNFQIDGAEFDLYCEVTRFVKVQSARAAQREEDPRARAVGFLMTLYQRRLASSTFALQQSLENRAKRLDSLLKRGQQLLAEEVELPDLEDLEEMEEAEREKWEERLALVSLARNPEESRQEIAELTRLGQKAEQVKAEGAEAKLSKLRELLQEQGFFSEPDKRLIIFTEFKDTLDYLVDCLRTWGFRVGFIHGSMKSGSRDEPGTRLWAEQQFKDGKFQILVATEAAGEGINLQFCHVMFNYDIPWNPNRLEQRMGRIHRYGQKKDCLIFNFVATNTVEGRVLQRLLEKLQEIRDALDDDAVFNVVGEVLPAAHIDRVLRDYYAGKLGEQDLESRLLRDVSEDRFRAICQTALEGLATKRLNLDMLVERRARAQEHRVVPETIARFLTEAAPLASFSLTPQPKLPHTFDPGPTPGRLRRFEQQEDWRLPPLSTRYPRISTDRKVAEENSLEWVTPGHPLFEALRLNALGQAQPTFADGACFYSLRHDQPARLDFYRARVVDGLGQVIHERLFAVEQSEAGDPILREPGVLGDLQPAPGPGSLPDVAGAREAVAFLHEQALKPFLEEVRAERVAEVGRIRHHVKISLTELIAKADQGYRRSSAEVEQSVLGVYLAGSNTRRIGGALEPLLDGAALSKSAVSRLVLRLEESYRAWQRRDLAEEKIVYLYLDAIYPQVRSGGTVVSLAVLVALGVRENGKKVLLSLMTAGAESTGGWQMLLEDLAGRKMGRPRLVISDGNPGLGTALGRLWPGVAHQRCTAHKLRNLMAKAPKHTHEAVREDYHSIVYTANREVAEKAREAFLGKWKKLCPGVATSLEEAGEERLTFWGFPESQRLSLRTTNAIERMQLEFRRRVKTQAALPSEDAVLRLFFGLWVSGQIKLRRIRGYRDIGGQQEEAA